MALAATGQLGMAAVGQIRLAVVIVKAKPLTRSLREPGHVGHG